MADGSDSEMDLSDERLAGSQVTEISEEIFTDKAQFLNGIFSKVLDLVYPIESGLVDDFRAHGVMSSDEEHLIRAETTRRDKARKMWKLLRRVPSDVFEEFCYPAIRNRYPHVLEGKRFCQNGQGGAENRCMRHSIMTRMHLKRFGDLFPPGNGCTEDEYCLITESGDSKSSWDVAFGLCAKPTNKDNVNFRKQLRDILARSGVEVPDNFDDILSKGFPCTCQFQLPVEKPKRTSRSGKVQLPLKRDVFEVMKDDVMLSPSAAKQRQESSCGYPSTMDDLSEDRHSSVSINSQETTDAAVAEAEDQQDLKFDTREDKERYLAEMQDMNKAIKNASNIRPLLRELDGLREELSILMTMTTPETSRHPNDTRQIQKLLERAKEVKSTIHRDFQIALTVKKELGQVTGFQQKKILKRRQMLENEMKEATPFVDRAKTVYTDIRQVCRAAISDYRTQPVSEERLTIRPWPSGRHHHEMHGMARPDCLTTRGSKRGELTRCVKLTNFPGCCRTWIVGYDTKKSFLDNFMRINCLFDGIFTEKKDCLSTFCQNLKIDT